MTWKQRQRSLFAAEVDFCDVVRFKKPVFFEGTLTVPTLASIFEAADGVYEDENIGLVCAVDLTEGMIVLGDSTNQDHADRLCGFYAGAGVLATQGEIGIPGGGLTVGDLFFLSGTAGTVSTTPPTSGFQQQVAIAASTDRMIITIGQAILL